MHKPFAFSWLMIVCIGLSGCLDDDPLITDQDQDGYTDRDEVAAGSDPKDPTSIPRAPTPEPAEPAWPKWAATPEAAVLRPGGPIGWCTFNFLFEAPDGTGYIGTAAHCTEEVGQRIPLDGYGEIGTVVFDSDDTNSLVDFSLIELDADMHALSHPQVVNHMGPTGSITVDDLARGDIIQIHGYGMVVGDYAQTRDRAGFLIDWSNDEYNVDMPAVNGDSGSSLLHEPTGKAFGIISRYGFDNTPPSTDRGPIMPFIFAELEAGGFGHVRLATV